MCFFVVPGNSQVLLGMPDTAALKIINLNIDSIQAEVVECKTNTEQEIHMVKKALQTQTQVLKPNKMPTAKMAKAIQTNDFFCRPT